MIIFSTVRTTVGKKAARIGFVADERRINVGLTRARSSLLVIGHRHALAKNEHWRGLIQRASDRKYAFSRPTSFTHYLYLGVQFQIASPGRPYKSIILSSCHRPLARAKNEHCRGTVVASSSAPLTAGAPFRALRLSVCWRAITDSQPLRFDQYKSLVIGHCHARRTSTGVALSG